MYRFKDLRLGYRYCARQQDVYDVLILSVTAWMWIGCMFSKTLTLLLYCNTGCYLDWMTIVYIESICSIICAFHQTDQRHTNEY